MIGHVLWNVLLFAVVNIDFEYAVKTVLQNLNILEIKQCSWSLATNKKNSG